LWEKKKNTDARKLQRSQGLEKGQMREKKQMEDCLFVVLFLFNYTPGQKQKALLIT